MRKKIVAVIGSRECSDEVEQIAHELGKKLAQVVDVLICGGLGGVMKAVCSGFKSAGGLTIGVLPGYAKDDANEFVDIVFPTGMGLARNVLIVSAADAVVALPGEAGTLSEIAYCLQFKVPVVSLRSWDIPGVIQAQSVEEAVSCVKSAMNKPESAGRRGLEKGRRR